MFVEFFMEVFFIKIKLHGYIENITKKEKEKVETLAIKNKNNLKFIHNNTTYKITFDRDSIIIMRENEEINHKLHFILNKETKSEYYIKEYLTNIDVSITTTKLLINEQMLEIHYIVNDSEEKYKYLLEMSEL